MWVGEGNCLNARRIWASTLQNRAYQSKAGFQTPPTEDGNCESLLQIADVAGNEEECEVINDRMDLFSTTRYQLEER
ncbi:hypothetical protein J5I95_05445 [Candidatus Poribacteria bacterium]|nr:hypothetical protein [Candidatus Poribacteria bacterium]